MYFVAEAVRPFTFSVTNVPDADFYGLEISHRGMVRYSKADLEAKGWTVALTLGH